VSISPAGSGYMDVIVSASSDLYVLEQNNNALSKITVSNGIATFKLKYLPF
jgi:hypothetical protein